MPRPAKASRGITTFLIEKDMPGFSIGQKIDKMGMRGSPTAELVFDDCEVPEENVMGPLNGGVGVLMAGLDYERTVLAGIQLGIMQACLDVVVPYVRERKQFGKPIGSFQLMQAKVADMYVALNSARAYVYAVAKNCDAGKTTRFDAAGAILLASESAVKVAGEAIQALGGAGYTKDWPVERYLARRQAARHRRGHQRDPPHADRARIDRRGRLIVADVADGPPLRIGAGRRRGRARAAQVPLRRERDFDRPSISGCSHSASPRWVLWVGSSA